MLSRSRDSLLELLFPRHCIHSGRPMRQGDPYRYLSAQAAATLEWIEEPEPQRLFAPFNGDFLARAIYLQLLEEPRTFRRSMSLFVLRGAGRSLVHELKYRNGLYLKEDIAQLVRECPPAREFLQGATLVPIPLHKTRERERGFNQSMVIGSALVPEFAPAIAPLLVRTRATRSQTRLSRAGRENNLLGAFALAPGAVVDPHARYVLLDDVFTTGATLGEAASVLREHGAAPVDTFTLGHG